MSEGQGYLLDAIMSGVLDVQLLWWLLLKKFTVLRTCVVRMHESHETKRKVEMCGTIRIWCYYVEHKLKFSCYFL